MHDFHIHTCLSAPVASREILADIESVAGFIPNVYGLLANAPQAIAAVTALNRAFDQSAFSAQEREIIALTTSLENQCAYCVAGHTAFALQQGVAPKTVAAIRECRTTPEPRHEALRNFTATLVRTRGVVESADIENFFEAGFDTHHVFELLIGIAAKCMTNFASKLAAIPLDKAFALHAWEFAATGSFKGGCNAQNTQSGPCEDQQFAVHRATKDLYQNEIATQGDDHE